MEPKPENVDGSIIRKHSFHHEVNWGLVMGSVAVLALVWIVYTTWGDGSSGDGAEGGLAAQLGDV